ATSTAITASASRESPATTRLKASPPAPCTLPSPANSAPTTSPTPSTRAARPPSAAPSRLRCFFYGERYLPERGRFLRPLILSRAPEARAEGRRTRLLGNNMGGPQ